jgi:hypothetical protein
VAERERKTPPPSRIQFELPDLTDPIKNGMTPAPMMMMIV